MFENQPTTGRARKGASIAALLATAVLALSACSGGGASQAAPSDDPNATLLVWTDSTRQAGFEAFQKANPNVKMKIETVDGSALLTKIQLFNRTGSGWPDVVFSQNPDDATSLSSSQYNYMASLDSLVSQDVQKGFGNANQGCTQGGKLMCLKNDLAQDVLWYNKPLMEKFGYKLPTTWDEYQALGKKVAAEHPGYIIGAAGDTNVYYDYFWSSGCPLQTVVSDTEVKINTKDPKCTRVADMLDPLLANGSVAKASPFDPSVAALGKDQKVLMMPGASWFGDFVFKPAASFGSPEGVIAAAPIPAWSGEPTNYSGAQGGGIYMVSSHSKNTAGAVKIALWMATSNDYQTTAPTYPAYGPAATAWAARLASDKFYAENPFPVLQAAAGKINPAESPTRYGMAPALSATVTAAIKSGKTIASSLEDLQTQLAGVAQTTGYAVTQ
ncbi:ABC-type glycerol-3-phosphate transport system substrate-binding protein [Arthrobacter pascens]|uniref:ABC transporter substrate-binding protein n=1 Tax=Arthrobacter pascens TaxID=1677 RepID=UPI0027819E73|nr:extracellular solute-binding protein [Arthrobacter pascens]MDQ0634175.1 ABC-type glycerol-3-phosphate transport system substrate-binding protein [Arthrobacter pascens]